MSVHIYNIPSGEKISQVLKVSVNGEDLPVREMRVSAVPLNCRWPGHQRPLSQTETAYFVSFETDEAVDMMVVYQNSIQAVVIKPSRYQIACEKTNNSASFRLSRPGGYTVEADGMHHALHILVDPMKAYFVDPHSKDTLYFGAGVHDMGTITLKSNQTLYIEEDAVVYASVQANGAENIRIIGKGMIDNSNNLEEILFEATPGGHFAVDNCVRNHAIHFTRCKNIHIEGVTIRNSLVYNIATNECENFVVDNVKIIGCWRYNSDGIDMMNSKNCTVRNCFIRTFDDSICIKGISPSTMDCENILVENCVIWCDWGRALEIGAETYADHIHNITFRNCTILRTTNVALDIQNVDHGEIYDVTFENICVEYDAVHQRPTLQQSEEEVYVTDPKSDFLPYLIVLKIIKHHEYSYGRERRGKIHDVLFRNIQVSCNGLPPIELLGYDKAHCIDNITLENIKFSNILVKNIDALHITTNQFAQNIKMK